MTNLSGAVEWVVKRISALTRTATDADLTDSEYMAVDNASAYTRKITVASLAAWVLGKIKSLATSITSFRTGDVIPVDGPSGTAKMSKDSLLQETANNALGSIHNLATTATESDFVAGNYLALDGSAGTKKLGAEKLVDVPKSIAIAVTSRVNGIESVLIDIVEFADNKGLSLVDGSEVSFSNSQVSDYIDIIFGIASIRFANRHGSTYGLCFYDKNKNFISGVDAYDGGTALIEGWYYSTTIPTIPSNARYIRIGGNKALSSALSGKVNDLHVEIKGAIDSAINGIVGIDYTLVTYTNRNENKGLDTSGELVTFANSQVSDFIAVTDAIDSVHYCNYAIGYYGICFYDENKNFISGVSAHPNGTQAIGNWYYSTTVPTIPYNAKYVRVAGNNALNHSASISLYQNVVHSVDKADAPVGYKEFFTYNVDCGGNDVDDSQKSTSKQDYKELSTDNGLIMLPYSYSASGNPTRLVAYNHGAGGVVTSSAASQQDASYIELLLARGYAVLMVNGIPNAYRNTKYCNAAQNGAAAHMGGDIFLRSFKSAYDYVVNKYNLTKEIFVTGQSMGGLASLNIANSGIVPVLAVAIDAPVIDLYKDAYFSGGWSGGTLNAGTFGVIAWMYQFNGFDFSNDTYTINGVTKSMSDLKNSSADCIAIWEMNKNKVAGYNAYVVGNFLVQNLDGSYVNNNTTDNMPDYFGKKLKCPCKIWFGDEDNVNQLAIAKRFVSLARNGGSIITMRTLPTSQHGVWGVQTTSHSVDVSTTSDGITCGICDVELADWLDRWN